MRGSGAALAAAFAFAAIACGAGGKRETPASATPAARVADAASAPVAARGRLRPKDGILHVAGPSDFVTVVGRLLVEEGQTVKAGQVIAETDTLRIREARIVRLKSRLAANEAALARAEAEGRNATIQNGRVTSLSGQGLLPASERDASDAQLDVAKARVVQAKADIEAERADLASAEAERNLSLVRSPVDGQVLKIHARAGAKVGPEGIAELARTGEMYAVAEVYDSDVPRVKVGQRARITSPALPQPLTGVVERIGMKVGRLQSVDPDPAAKVDARVVEVDVRLDQGSMASLASRFTDLEVEILIGP